MSERLRYPEAARYVGIPLGTMYALVSKRLIPHIRLGPRLVLFDREELDAWVKSKGVPEDLPAAQISAHPLRMPAPHDIRNYTSL